MIYQLQFRRDTEANWTLYNPVLKDAEIGVITDVTPRQFVCGDGTRTFSQLPRFYLPQGQGGVSYRVVNNS